jgi:TolB protein
VTELAAFVVLLLAIFAMTPVRANAQVDVWPSPLEAVEVYRIPLWLPQFQVDDPSLLSRAQTLEQVLYQDLEFCGLFEIIRKKPVVVGMNSTNLSIQVQGKVSNADGRAVFEGTVTDVASGDFIGGKRYEIKESSIRRTVHHFSDEVIHMVTGERGVALTSIVFTRKHEGQWELVVCDYDGYSPRVLVRQSVPLLEPRWADQNRAVVYTSFRAGKADLYIRYLDESQSRTLATGEGMNYTADWSDRREMILAALSRGGNSEIYLLDKTGVVKRQLTFSRAIDTSPCWSPSGREMVFTSDRSGTPQLYILEVDGTNLRRLSFAGGYNESPAWSPRGDQIAFVTRIEGRFQLAIITPDGRDGRLLTEEAGGREDPRWAPDGRHMVHTERTGSQEAISVIDIKTRGRRILAQGANADWSTR